MNLEFRRQKRKLRIFQIGLWFLAAVSFSFTTHATHSSVLLGNSSCQELDIETLTDRLLENLPGYANRVTLRDRHLNSYVIIAGRPEFAPLTLGPGVYQPAPASDPEPPQQVFITTLERQYTAGKAVELQQFHWLFLTRTSSGWRLATMFSRTGTYPKEQPPTPPRESSNGVIGQAIHEWLRDCRAGTVWG